MNGNEMKVKVKVSVTESIFIEIMCFVVDIMY